MSPEVAEAFVRWTARLVVVCYLLRCWLDSRSLQSQSLLKSRLWTRNLWTAGAVLFVIHVFSALILIHDFSHVKAYEHTAERTFEVVGVRWGGGIYVNHVFMCFWVFDVLGWWRTGEKWAYGSNWYYWSVQAIFAFMFINATVVFGPPHWIWMMIGLIILIVPLKVFRKFT